MKNTNLLVTALTLMSVSAFSQVPKWKLESGAGVYSANFRWSIAGNEQGNSPNILSELRWQDLRGPQINLQITRTINQFEIAVGFEQYIIKKGSGTDIDYLQDNRTEPFYEQYFLSNKGSVQNYSLVLKRIYETGGVLKLNPYLGLNLLSQNLYILDGEGQLANVELNSNYKTSWRGVLAGIEIIYPLKGITLSLNTLGGYYTYVGKATWNLNPKFKQPLSFKQAANGYNVSAKLKAGFLISKSASIFLMADKQYTATWQGVDQAYLSDGSTPKTKFNGAIGNSIGITTCITTSF